MSADLVNNRGLLQRYTFSLLIFLLLCLYIIYYRMFLLDNSELDWPKKMSVDLISVWPPPSPPLILTWTNFFGQSLMKFMLKQNNVSQCPYLCQYSSDRSLERNASIIIFHIRDQLTPLPQNRSADQLYVFFLLESPIYTGNHRNDIPPDFFNISITYLAKSDIIYPYDAFDKLDGTERGEEFWSEEEIQQKMAAKSDLALQIVSNCQTSSRREVYLEELRKYANLTRFGKCAKEKGKEGADCDNKCAERMIDSHLFYLAFENSVCQNYVTEKFWHIKWLIVPIVLSRRVFLGMNVPNDSFIAADDFGSPKELAEHLNMLAANRTEYMNYLQWTRKFKRTEHRKEPKTNPLCQLCELAWEKQPRRKRIIENIVEFWDGAGQCQGGFAENLLRKNKLNNLTEGEK